MELNTIYIDSSVPGINNVTFSSNPVDVTEANQNLVINFDVVDDWSGVDTVWCTLYGFNTPGNFTINLFEVNQNPNNITSGSLSCTIPIYSSYQQGTYRLMIRAWDQLDNLGYSENFFDITSNN